MTKKPYKDEFEKKNPKEYFRYFKFTKKWTYQKIGDIAFEGQGLTKSNRRVKAQRWTKTKEEMKEATLFKKTETEQAGRIAIREKPAIWKNVPVRMWYSRMQLGKQFHRYSGTPEADVVFYFDPEKDKALCETIADEFEVQGAKLYTNFELRDYEGEFHEGASVIQTDSRDKTYHAKYQNGKFEKTASIHWSLI